MAEATNTVTVTATGKRKQRVGEVVSNKMTKTIVVRVERRFPHQKFKKIITSYKKFYAHDEKAEAKVGDTVRIEESRPLSKLKRWKLIEVVERSAVETAVTA
ncbi:MAG TPA: 30S ribosomal protein S17 [Verrucomicrobiae bacterium]|jgi:small subunit ribosomal protein S17|nr:30S ribosomal protein S17 [Verrucomicrobiae bacterium]